MGALLRHLLRVHRGFLVGWLAGLAAFTAMGAPAYHATYPDPEQMRIAAAAVRDQDLMRFLYGRMGDLSIGAFSTWEIGAWVGVLAAVMAVLLAVRVGRGAEEAGHAELLGALGLGPRTRIGAQAAVLLLAAAALAAACTLVLLAVGLRVPDLPAGSSALFGASMGLTAAAFGAAGLLLGQVTGTARGARLAGLGLVGAVYLARGVADVAGGAVREIALWLLPLSWRDNLAAFSANRWWPAPILLAGALAVLAAAAALARRRDLGATWPPRARRDRDVDPAAVPGRSLGALVRHDERGAVLGWALAVLALAWFGAGFAADARQLLTESRATAELMESFAGGGGDPAEIFVNLMGARIGLLLACAGVQVALGVRREERAGRLCHALAAGVPRPRAPLVFAAVAAAAVAGLGLAGGALSAVTAWRVVGADLAGTAFWSIAGLVPAALVFAGLAALLAGAAPTWTWLAWVAVAVAGALGFFGELLKVPGWVMDLSPLEHPLRGLDGVMHYGAGAVLLLIAAALVAAGAALIRRRDLIG